MAKSLLFKVVVALLIASMLVIGLAGCGGPKNTTAPTTTTNGPDTHGEYPPQLEGIDSLTRDKEVTFVYVEGGNGTYTADSIWVDPEAGDLDDVDNGIIERNNKIYENLGVTITPYPFEGGIADLQGLTKTMFDTQDDTIDVYCGYQYFDISLATQAHLYNLMDIQNENGEALVDNIEEISEVCDGVMVARGDMGVEIPFEQLPAIQKMLITKCRMLGKRVITATEMLESMIQNPRPTRAEISDIANAVYDGTSAIMLSGETAAGKYPVEAVKTMAKIAETTEGTIDYKERFYDTEFTIKSTADAISHATCGMSIDIKAKAIVACSLSGMTARMVSRFRSPVDIIGLTTDEATWRKLSLSWGVVPAMAERFTSTDVLFYTAKKIAQSTFSLTKDDKIVITGGDTAGQSGNTNLIKVERV